VHEVRPQVQAEHHKAQVDAKAVARITQAGAPATMSGMAANCELPAKTVSVMATASNTLMPDLTMATPVISPQAAMPGDCGETSRMPSRKPGWR